MLNQEQLFALNKMIMNKNGGSRCRGYTLIELSVVMILVILISSTLVSMLAQQTQFFRWWQTQDFIAEEAPLTNAMVVRLFSNADAFRIHDTQANAILDAGGTTAGGAAMTLGFTEPDGTKIKGILWFIPGTTELWYGVFNAAGNAVPAGNTWRVARGIDTANSSFSVVSGTMQLTLTGPFGGQVTYAATPSL